MRDSKEKIGTWTDKSGEEQSIEIDREELNTMIEAQMKRTKRSSDAKSFVAAWLPEGD